MTLSPEELTRLRALYADIPRDLRIVEDGCEHASDTDVRDSADTIYVLHRAKWSAEPFLRFAVEARTALPALLDECERLQSLATPPAIKIALRVLLNHVEPGWENCVTVLAAWLGSLSPDPGEAS